MPMKFQLFFEKTENLIALKYIKSKDVVDNARHLPVIPSTPKAFSPVSKPKLGNQRECLLGEVYNDERLNLGIMPA